MRVNLLWLMMPIVLFPVLCWAQTSHVLSWKPADPDAGSLAYHPEPILFVHGINDNDAGWGTALSALQENFQAYYITLTAKSLIAADQNSDRYKAQQQPFLHTFNYGNYVKKNMLDNAQSFDHIEWNAWDSDMRTRAFTNMFLRTTATNITYMKWQSDSSKTGGHLVPTTVTLLPDPDAQQQAPNDERLSLDVRIKGNVDGSIIGLCQAYRAGPGLPLSQIVLVAHSMGGLLSHYYLCKCEEAKTNSGVRRLVTLATPHCGSPVANDMYRALALDPVDRITHGGSMTLWYKFARGVTLGRKDPVGYARYSAGGALGDLSVSIPGNGDLAYSNDFQTYISTHSAPTIEYVFNAFTMPVFTLYKSYKMFGGNADAWTDVKNGDGVVSLASAAGKRGHISPSIWNGQDPVIYGPWLSADHSDANKHVPSLLASLFGVPNQWPGPPARPPLGCNVAPPYARTYDENQSFGKYLSCWYGWEIGQESYWASDEPGIGNVILLCKGASSNPFVLPALDTWGVTNDNFTGFDLPQKMYTATTDLIGHQIIGGSQSQLRALALVGAKNHTRTPFGWDGTNVWAVDGNEYLPACLSIHYSANTAPIDSISNPFQSDCISSSLTMLDSTSSPQYQYGLFDRTFNSSAYRPQAPNSIFFAIEGTNLAGFCTPQAERGVNVPVDSATMVSVLCGINEREKAVGQEPSRWTQMLTEWIDVPATGVFKLNFVPTEQIDPTYNNPFVDAFCTQTPFTDWTYDSASQTITLNNPGNSPSCLMASYEAYLGGIEEFTVYQGEYSVRVPALTARTLDALAGVPVTMEFVQNIQECCEALISQYVDHRQGDFSNLAAVPMWQTTNSATAHYMYGVMASGQTGWRRQVVPGEFTTAGPIETGDIIGPWIFEDMQRALKLMMWVPVGLGFQVFASSPQLNNAKGQSCGDADVNVAKASVGTGWDDTLCWQEFGLVCGSMIYNENVVYSVRAYRQRSYAVASGLSFGSCAVDVYFPAAKYQMNSKDVATFDDNGDNIIESTGIGYRQRQLLYDGTGSLVVWFGNEALPVPVWADTPMADQTTSRGYQVYGDGCFVFHAGDAFAWK